MILDQIVQHKYTEIETRRGKVSLEQLRERARDVDARRPFHEALLQPGVVNIIGEIKRRSPSGGTLCDPCDVGAIASIYQTHGVAAVSVLTDQEFFGGSLDDLRTVRQAVQLPILRKDFILDVYQLYEAVLAGADAVLLIAAVLDEGALADLMAEAHAAKLAALVEVHDERDLAKTLAVGAKLVGINNRDLNSLTVDIDTTERLISRVPSSCTTVSESGIASAEDIQQLQRLNVDAALIGETLMRSVSLEETLTELVRM